MAPEIFDENFFALANRTIVSILLAEDCGGLDAELFLEVELEGPA